MTSKHILTDLVALARNRARAKSEALFLQRTAAEDVQDRLDMVNRTFTAPAIVTAFPEVWGNVAETPKIIPDTETLALEPEAHDLIVHALGLHWANDPVGQLIQCRRALQPDGLLIAIFFGGQTLHQLRTALSEAEVSVSGGLSPRVAPMGDIRDLGSLLQRAGLALPVADSVQISVTYQSMYHLMHDLRAMGENNAMLARTRKSTPRSIFNMAAQIYTKHFGGPDERIPATFELVCLTGWAPDGSQPKPLRPGSAKQRLADALSVTETKL